MESSTLETERPLSPAVTAEPAEPVALTVIEPSRGRIGIDWSEIWRYRELLYFLTWRDVKVRYKQTFLGAAWAILQPFLTMIVFSLFFGRLAGLGEKTGGVPYPIYVYAGLLPWTFFANALTASARSLLEGRNLLTKVYFPRLVMPLASVGVGVVDLAVSFVVLLGMMVFYRTPISWQLLFVPLLLVGTLLAASGVGALLAAMSVAYRDFQYVVPFMVQLWMFVTPVIYPSSIVPEQWRWAFALNPMAGLIEGFRAAFLGSPLDPKAIATSLASACLVFIVGAWYFRRVERSFADLI